MPTACRFRSYAKINTYLDVLPRRADGYHDIETLFVSVSLFDELRFETREGGIELTCNDDSLGPPGENLAVRAARLLQEGEGCTQGVAITLDKRIPVAAGLAGGSGNAAATLVALNLLWELGLPHERLLAYGLELGSDVPFCLAGGYAAATGRGEVLTPLPAPAAPRWFVLVHPAAAVSTPAIFQHPELVKNDAPIVDGRTEHFARIVQWAADLAEASVHAPANQHAGALYFNRMQPVTFALHPELAEWTARLADLGCLQTVMSGTGPTLVGLCEDEADARRVAQALEGVRVSVVQEMPVGVEAIEEDAA